MMDVHKDVSLPEILKVKQSISTRIEDFDIDCVLDEETQVNIMIEETWKILGKPTVVPSLGRIGLCWHRGRPRVQCYNNSPTKP
jgi:hypothetical protein